MFEDPNLVVAKLARVFDALDHQYLDRWAPALDVTELLARARSEQRTAPWRDVAD